METAVDQLIKQYYELNPDYEGGNLNHQQIGHLHQKLFVLSQPHYQNLINHLRNTKEGRKLEKFVHDEVTKTLKLLGKDESVILGELMTDLMSHNPFLQEEVMSQARAELDSETP